MVEKTVSEIRVNGKKCNIKRFYWGKTDTTYIVGSKYKVTFIASGSTYATKEVEKDSTVGEGNMPSNPARSGYTFVRWVYGTSDSQFTSDTKIVNNLTVTAYWLKYIYSYPTCTTCNGLGTISGTCPDCNGTGKETCVFCDGDGYTDDGYVECNYCYGGCKMMVCHSCGNYFTPNTCPTTCSCGETRFVEVDCPICDGKGETYVPGHGCSVCNGTGKMTCTTCDGEGSGKWDCSVCKGNGYTKKVDYVYEKY